MEASVPKDPPPSSFSKFLTFLKFQTFGKVSVGIYYQKKQKYLSMTSVILSIFGIILFLALSINIIVRIFNYEQVTTINNLISSSENNLIDLSQKVSVENFKDRSRLSFKIKAYSFDTLLHEPLACSNLEMTMFYNVPTVKNNTHIPVSTVCNEINGALNYTI